MSDNKKTLIWLNDKVAKNYYTHLTKITNSCHYHFLYSDNRNEKIKADMFI